MYKIFTIILILFLCGCYRITKDTVYCPYCKNPLFEYGQEVKESCHKDHAPTNGYLYWFWERDYNLPKMAYDGQTYLLKNEQGYYWHPYELNLED